MEYIVGTLLPLRGLTWQVLGSMGSDPKEDAVTINFSFGGSPPTSREARMWVRDRLSSPENKVAWFSVRGGNWIVDLRLLRRFFELDDPKFDWLDSTIEIEPEYNVLPARFKKTEMQGVLSLVFDRTTLEEAAEVVVPSTREKQQKFKILDAPSLLTSDLEVCRGQAAFGTAVLYLDIDHFKNLNTALTEREVDKAIMPGIHGCIRDAATNLGYAYAEGGDEFIVLLPNANEAIAASFAEALRATLAELVFEAQGRKYRVTASIGLATTETWPLDDLPDQANLAKRRAKEVGRNCVVIARRDVSKG